jgi:hypothetical protein
MSDQEDAKAAEEAEEETTDFGEGERGTASSPRSGTFRSTPGETGDRSEGAPGGPGVVIPHKQDS